MFQKYKANWKFTVPGTVLIPAGVFVISRGLPFNTGLLLLGLLLAAAGIWLVWHGLKCELPYTTHTSPFPSGASKTIHGRGVPSLDPNTMLLYPDHFEFEYQEDSTGLPWIHTNTGKSYRVLEQDKEGAWKELELPDHDPESRYYPPDEYANAATMPATKRYLEWQPSLFQKVAFFACGVIIVVEVIALVIITGN